MTDSHTAQAQSFEATTPLGETAPGGDPLDADSAGRKNLLLLIQLRWIAVGGQIATMAVVSLVFHVVLPVGAMAAVLVALVALNLASLARLSRASAVTNPEIFTALVLDVAALSLQFYLTGGATNPFTFLYLLQVTLGAVLLDAGSTWMLVGLTSLCFAALTFVYRPLDLGGLTGETPLGLYIDGSVICFLLDAALLVVFVTRINANLRERDTRLAAFRQQASEEDHIVRIGLLASGAAHELGTPLATLSVILGDWRRMPALNADPELMSEIAAMEAEVRRCKAILSGILLSAGETRGESAAVTTLRGFLDDLVADWRAARSASTLHYHNAIAHALRFVSDTSLKQVIVNLLDNAYEASPAWVSFEAAREGAMLLLRVRDAGPGFAPGMLEQIGKPYRSTKGKPGGGLGLFLVVNVVRKLGGRVNVANAEEGGALVDVHLPLSALTIASEDRNDE